MVEKRPSRPVPRKTGEHRRKPVSKTADQIFEVLPDLIFRLDAEGTFLEFMGGKQEELFREPGQFLGRPLAKVLPPEVADFLIPRIKQVIRSGKPASVDYLLPMARGPRRFEARLVPSGKGDVLALVRSITHDEPAETVLREIEGRYHGLVELSPAAIAVHDGKTVLYVNRAAAALLAEGERDRVIGRPVADFVHPDSRPIVAQRIRNMLASRKPMPLTEERFLRMDGTPVDVEVTASSFQEGQRTLVQVIFRDISRRKADERAIHRLNHLNAFLAAMNQAIVRVDGRDELFRQICRVAVEKGGMTAAWVGLVDADGQRVSPAAAWGHTAGYPEAVRITRGRNPEGKGPTGRAIREGRVVFCNDIGTDPSMAPWREQALQRGYRSSAAVPIRSGGKTIGAVNLYAPEPHAFGDEELAVLEAVAADLEFALGALEQERRRREAEAALVESEENFRGLFDQSKDGIFVTLADGRILSCNNAALRMFMYSPQELESVRAEQLYADPAERLRLQDAIEREGSVRNFEVRLRRKDGTVFDCLLSAAVHRGSGGRTLGYQGIIHDITERKRMEEALRSSEQRYRSIFVEGPLGMAVVGLDSRFIQVNARFCRMLGYEEAELIGRSFIDITHPDHIDLDRANVARLVRGEMALYKTEKRYLRKGGEILWGNVTLSLIWDGQGTPLFFHAMVEDITEQRMAREALLDSQRNLLQAQEMAQLGSYVFDIPANRWVSSPILDGIFGIGPEYPHTIELWMAILHPDDRGPMADYWEARLKDLGRFDREYRIVRAADGQERWVHGLGEIETSPDGRPARMVGTIQDITDRKAAEEELRIKHLAMASSLNGIAIIDLRGRLTYVNAAILRMWGFAEVGEVLGRRGVEFWADPENARAIVGPLMERGSYQGQLEARRKDGTVFPVEFSGHLVRDAAGRPLCIMGLFADITERRAAEAALEASERKYKALVETTGTGFVIVDGAGRVIDANDEYVRMTGRASQADLLGRPVSEWTAPEDLDRNAAAVRQCAAEGSIRNLEIAYITPAGTVTPVEINATVVPGPEGAHIVTLVRDISSRKAREAALRESEAQQRALSENLAEGMVYQINSGPDGRDRRFTYLSPAVERLHELSLDEALRDPSLIYGQVVGPDRERLAEAEAAAGAARTAVNVDVQVRLPSGEVRWRRFISNPRALPNGDIVWDGIELDITERKRAGAALRESEEKYRTLVESARDAIFVADAETGVMIEVNRQAEILMGRPAGELVGMHQSLLHPAEERDRYRRIFAEHSGGGNLLARDLLVRRADGTDVPVDISATVVEVGGRKLVHGVFQDITDRKWAEKALQESLDMLQRSMQGTILAMMTMVEMRDPFTAGHQSRVARLACAIGRAMGMNEHQVEGLRVAGLLHDIGKIGVPAEILSKPGRILDFEYNIIKSHSEIGHKILREIDFPWPIATMVLHHHERLDGSGYPDGLKAGAIMLESRILVVADVVEAMASHRPYRPARGVDLALGEVELNKGILYDPDVVEACLRLFRDHHFTLD